MRVGFGFGSGQSGRGSKRVTGQNGSFLNGSIGLRVKRVAGQTGRVKTGLTRFAMSSVSCLENKPGLLKN